MSKSTLFRWLAAGKRGDERFRGFRDQIRAAEACAELTMSDVLFTAAKTDARYALEWLGRRRSKSWGRREVEKRKPAAPCDLAAMPREQLNAHAAKLTADLLEDDERAEAVRVELERRGLAFGLAKATEGDTRARGQSPSTVGQEDDEDIA